MYHSYKGGVDYGNSCIKRRNDDNGAGSWKNRIPSQGFSVSGVMDVRSFKIANLLLDNPENEAVLEFTLIGPTLEFTSETIISITGGDFRPQINGKPAKMYTQFICIVEIF